MIQLSFDIKYLLLLVRCNLNCVHCTDIIKFHLMLYLELGAQKLMLIILIIIHMK